MKKNYTLMLGLIGLFLIEIIADTWFNEIWFIVPILFLFSSVKEVKKRMQLSTKINGEDDKIEITEELSQNDTIYSFNTIYLFSIMVIFVYLTKLYQATAINVLADTKLLFQFVIAALFILVVRYMIGLHTFSFFGTSVIALSWIAIGPFWGPIVFLNVFALAYIIRKLVEPYNLAVGYRVGLSMMTIVVALTLFNVMATSYNLDLLSTGALLPIIITPWIADRYVKVELEQSSLDAFVRFTATMLVVFGSFLVMQIDPIIEFVLYHPSTWLMIFAIMLFMGRGQDFTLMDRKRFYRLFKNQDDPLTISSRNRDYIAKYNQEMLFPIINKFDLKEQFDKWNVPTSQILGVVSQEEEIAGMVERLKTEEIFENGFVIKPSQSFGGRGIEVITSRTTDGYFMIGEEVHTAESIQKHLTRIIKGDFLTSQTVSTNDIAIIEEIIIPDEDFGGLGIGLSDIRVIIFRGIPVMTMARIPTEISNGLANLKQGAIGAAIKLSNGKISRAEFKKHELSIHGDTDKELVGYQFDNWQEILAVSVLAQKSTGLGYAGVDLVLDHNKDVQVLEVNKRPGLEIQNINLSSLLSRLETIEKEDLDARQKSPIAAAKRGMELAEKWEEEQ